MKKFFTLLTLVLCALAATAQKNNIGYSLVIKDASGELVTERNVKIRVQLGAQIVYDKLVDGTLSSGIASAYVYSETHDVKTDKNGVASIMIGTGTVPAGNKHKTLDFDFSDGHEYGMVVEIDPDGNGYSIKGSSMLTSVPFAMSAQTAVAAKSADNAASLGDVPLTTLNVQLVNTSNNGVTVSILGQQITESGSKTFSVPAYSPIFLSVKQNSSCKYTVKLNGEAINVQAGSYERASEYTSRVYDTGGLSSTYDYNSNYAYYEYFPVLDNIEGDKSGTDNRSLQKLNADKAAGRNYRTASKFTITGNYENNVNIQGTMLTASDIWQGLTDLKLRHYTNNTTNPLFVKIPSFSYKNSLTVTPIYKHGYNGTYFLGEMKNEIIGPFPAKTNTLVIEVSEIVN